MRTLRKNKQKLYYALQIGEQPQYELDEDGNKIIDYIDDEGNVYYRQSGDTDIVYSKPVPFFGNIVTSGGESEIVEFGVNLADYEAILVTSKGLLPINETSRIWQNNAPVLNVDGTVDEHSADYTVVKVSQSLNVDKYILKKIVK